MDSIIYIFHLTRQQLYNFHMMTSCTVCTCIVDMYGTFLQYWLSHHLNDTDLRLIKRVFSNVANGSEEKSTAKCFKIVPLIKTFYPINFFACCAMGKKNFFALRTTRGRSENYITIKRTKYEISFSKIFGRLPFPFRDHFGVAPPNSCSPILYLP